MNEPVTVTMTDTMAERIERLEAKCNRLEWQARRWRRFGSTALISVAVLIAGGAWRAEIAESLSAKRFLLMSDDGGEVLSDRALLDVTPHLGTILQLKHKGTPAPQIVLNAAPGDKSFMSVKDAKGRPRIYLGLEPDGKPKLIFTGDDGRELLRLPNLN